RIRKSVGHFSRADLGHFSRASKCVSSWGSERLNNFVVSAELLWRHGFFRLATIAQITLACLLTCGPERIPTNPSIAFSRRTSDTWPRLSRQHSQWDRPFCQCRLGRPHPLRWHL